MSDRELPPVSPNAERPEKWSQSFLARMNVCARSGLLYLTEKGGPSSHALDRGTCLHFFAERFIEALIENDEHSAPPEVAKDVLETVVAEHPELQLPIGELDALRVMAYHLAEGLWIEPETVVAVEKMLELEIAGVTVRGRVDFAAVQLQAHHATIYDWKSQWNIPSQEEFEHSFQTPLYGLLLAEGKSEDDAVPIGKEIDTFTIAEVYPRFRDLPERKVTLSRQQLMEFKRDVETVIQRAELGFEAALWPAVPGSHCARCPAPALCPLPPDVIPVPLPGDDASLRAERVFWLQAEASEEQKRLKASASESPTGSIPFGSDMEFAFTVSESERVKDLPGLKGLIAQAGLEESDFITKTTSTRFGKRKRGA